LGGAYLPNEKELQAQELHGFLIPEREELLDISAGGLPVDFGDSFFKLVISQPGCIIPGEYPGGFNGCTV